MSIFDDIKRYLGTEVTEKDLIEVTDFTDESFDDALAKAREKNNLLKGYNNAPEKFDETDEEYSHLLHDEIVSVKIRRLRCPKCGGEMKSIGAGLFFNPITQTVGATTECSCGFTTTTKNAYPKLVFTDKDNKEIKVFI